MWLKVAEWYTVVCMFPVKRKGWTKVFPKLIHRLAVWTALNNIIQFGLLFPCQCSHNCWRKECQVNRKTPARQIWAISSEKHDDVNQLRTRRVSYHKAALQPITVSCVQYTMKRHRHDGIWRHLCCISSTQFHRLLWSTSVPMFRDSNKARRGPHKSSCMPDLIHQKG